MESARKIGGFSFNDAYLTISLTMSKSIMLLAKQSRTGLYFQPGPLLQLAFSADWWSAVSQAGRTPADAGAAPLITELLITIPPAVVVSWSYGLLVTPTWGIPWNSLCNQLH